MIPCTDSLDELSVFVHNCFLPVVLSILVNSLVSYLSVSSSKPADEGVRENNIFRVGESIIVEIFED